MFRKLLKYDMKSVARLWWICPIIILISTICSSFVLRYITVEFGLNSILEFYDSIPYIIFILIFFLPFVLPIYILCIFIEPLPVIVLFSPLIVFSVEIARIFILALSFVFMMVLVYSRYYKNFFTDEGYLTFTLPVSRKKLFFSKTVNAFFWHTVHILLMITSIFASYVVSIVPEEGQLLNTETKDFLSSLINESSTFETFESILLIIALTVIALIFILQSISVFHFSITFSATIAKKARSIVTIGIYTLINSIIGVIWLIIGLTHFIIVSPLVDEILPDPTPFIETAIGSVEVLIIISILSITTIVLYAITQRMLNRKLNLN